MKLYGDALGFWGFGGRTKDTEVTQMKFHEKKHVWSSVFRGDVSPTQSRASVDGNGGRIKKRKGCY